MSLDEARTRVARSIEELRAAHAAALGSIEAELSRGAERWRTERARVDAETQQARSISLAKARNVVMARHGKVRDHAFALTAGGSGDVLKAATTLEIGQLLVNAKRAGVNTQLEVPLLVPLFGAGNITVLGCGNAADSLLRGIQLETLRETASGQLKLVSYDPMLRQQIAPFARLAETAPDAIRTIHLQKELDMLIEELTETVSRVGRLLLGGSDGLVEHRLHTGLQIERFRLIALSDYPAGVTQTQHERLLTLARAAARHGIAFLFHVPDPKALPDWLRLEDLIALGDSFEAGTSRVIWGRNPQLNCALPKITATEVTKAVDAEVVAAELATRVDLAALMPVADWTESSVDGLTVQLASAAGTPLSITFGDSMPHGLITGSSGSGKSNLIKLLIYGLGARYSPDEVELYLLDMKEGVTLAPMAPSAGSPVALPHARVLGLQADQEFGLSMLAEVERIYRHRMKEMSPYDNIKEYRKATPGARMPRIVLVIDEFQLLLEDDATRVGRDSAAKLLSLAKLVRAAGIHLIVATQEIGFSALTGIRDSLLAQLKLRIALQNTARGSEMTLESGNAAAAELTVRGEIVVNEEFGQRAANRIGRMPYADEAELTKLRTRWYDNRPAQLAPGIVFDGAPPAEFLREMPWLRAAREETARGKRPRLLLGRPVAVSEAPLSFTLDATPGRNLAVVGAAGDSDDAASSTHLALGIIEGCALSLAAQYPPGACDFIVLDLLGDLDREAGNVPAWLAAMTALGHTPRMVPPDEVKAWTVETAAGLDERTDALRPTFVFGLGFERVAPIMEREGGIGSIAPVKLLQKIWQQGPVTGLHCIFWWASGPMYLTHIEKKMEAFFSGTLVLFGAEEVAHRVNDLMTKWEGSENRGLFRDSAGAQGKRKMIPYRVLGSAEFDKFAMEFRA